MASVGEEQRGSEEGHTWGQGAVGASSGGPGPF